MTSQKNNSMKDYFEKIYEQTNRKVTIYLISKCKNFSDVNDIFQDVYLEYYQVLKRKGQDYIRDPEAFLINLCRKKIGSYYSFWERIPLKYPFDNKDFEEQDQPEVLGEIVDFEEDFFRKEMVNDVKHILEMQPMEVQKIFYLYYTMELKIAEIAALLNMKEQTVKNKLFRTRRTIRETLENWR